MGAHSAFMKMSGLRLMIALSDLDNKDAHDFIRAIPLMDERLQRRVREWQGWDAFMRLDVFLSTNLAMGLAGYIEKTPWVVLQVPGFGGLCMQRRSIPSVAGPHIKTILAKQIGRGEKTTYREFLSWVQPRVESPDGFVLRKMKETPEVWVHGKCIIETIFSVKDETHPEAALWVKYFFGEADKVRVPPSQHAYNYGV